MKPTPLRFGALSLASLLLGTACTPPATTSSTPAPLQAGQTIPISMSQDGKEVYRATMTVRNLEDPAARKKDSQGMETDLVALLETEDFVDSEYAKQRGVAAPPVPFDEVVAFLDQHWDAAFGDKDDPGRNAEEFLALLKDMAIDVPMFFAEYKKLGLSLKDYLTLISYIDAYDDLLGGQGFAEIVETLAERGLTLKDFLLYIENAELTTLEVFAALIGKQQTLTDFLAESAAAERTLQESLKALVQPTIQASENYHLVDPFIYTRSWTILDHGKATGIKGHVLNSRYGHPSWYTEGQIATSGTRSLILGAPSNPLVHCEWEVTCRYGVTATGASIGGKYVKDIEVKFSKIHTILGWQVNGRVDNPGVFNQGWADKAPDPITSHRVFILANFLMDSGFLVKESYRFTGSKGIQGFGTTGPEFKWTPFASVLITLP